MNPAGLHSSCFCHFIHSFIFSIFEFGNCCRSSTGALLKHESAWHSLFRLKVSGINLLPVCLTDCKVQELFNRHRIKRQRGPAQDYTPLCLCCRQDLELWSENNANTNMLQGASHLDALVAVRLLHGCNIAVAQWQ